MQNEQDAHADAQQQRSVRCSQCIDHFSPFRSHASSRMRMRFLELAGKAGPPLRVKANGTGRIPAA